MPANGMGTLLTRGPYTPRGYYRAAEPHPRRIARRGRRPSRPRRRRARMRRHRPLAGGHPLTLEGIREALQAMEVARYKLPEHLVIVDDLPLTKIGKVDKKALRELVREPSTTEETT